MKLPPGHLYGSVLKSRVVAEFTLTETASVVRNKARTASDDLLQFVGQWIEDRQARDKTQTVVGQAGDPAQHPLEGEAILFQPAPTTTVQRRDLEANPDPEVAQQEV